MRFQPTRLEGFVAIELDMHADERGALARTFCVEEFRQSGIAFEVVQANISLNPHPRTLRGMHFQAAPAEEVKLVRCTSGSIYDVVIDVRPESPTYLHHFAVELSAEHPVAGDAANGCQ